ncbi:MAG: hypothetical protein WCX48_11890 [Bacteroidales bacterium]
MSDYAINEYEWVPWDEEEDVMPTCFDCKYAGQDGNKIPCRGCEGIIIREGEPQGRNYFKTNSAGQ